MTVSDTTGPKPQAFSIAGGDLRHDGVLFESEPFIRVADSI